MTAQIGNATAYGAHRQSKAAARPAIWGGVFAMTLCRTT